MATSPSPSSLHLFATSLVVAFLLGWIFSNQFVSENLFLRLLTSSANKLDTPGASPFNVDTDTLSPSCKLKLSNTFPASLLQDLGLALHRNGDADPCGTLPADPSVFEDALKTFDVCLDSFDKFQFESWLTRVMNHVTGCEPNDLKHPIAPGFLGYCDRGPAKTPLLTDHHRLVRVPSTNTLPCHFHTREGVRITSIKQFKNLLTTSKTAPTCLPGDEDCAGGGHSSQKPSLHLYAVAAGRVFMFAPKFVGEVFELPHVTGDRGAPISLKVLSTNPRVFDVLNFFSRDESTNLVNRALKETSETHRIKRSTTGAQGKSVNSRRTSESGFDTHGQVAIEVKRRCFKILGFDEYVTCCWLFFVGRHRPEGRLTCSDLLYRYIEGHSDGLQMLRYNLTTAYIPHMDWIDDPSGVLPHDYDSGGMGGNRFSTILMYMTDLEPGAGGETVFTEAWPIGLPEDQRMDLNTALKSLRESGDAEGVLKHGSWEEEMVAQCRSKLAIRPQAGRAVLFYSQLPSGEPDPASTHGGWYVDSITVFV